MEQSSLPIPRFKSFFYLFGPNANVKCFPYGQLSMLSLNIGTPGRQSVEIFSSPRDGISASDSGFTAAIRKDFEFHRSNFANQMGRGMRRSLPFDRHCGLCTPNMG